MKRFWLSPTLGRLAFVIFFLLTWQTLVETRVVNPFVLPKPSLSFLQLWNSLLGGELGGALFTTAYEIAVAFLVSAALGMLVGYFFWRFDALGRAFETFLGAVFGTPTVLLYPIVLVLFGRTEAVPIVLGVMVGVFPVIINTHSGLAGVKAIFIKRGRSLLLSDFQIFRHILVPAAAPVIFSGLKLGLMYVMIGVTAAEYLIEIGGLGRLISYSYITFKVPMTYGYIIVVMAIVVIMVQLVNRVEARVR